MRYYMFNKPRGCITACRDERQKTVMDYLPEAEREGLFPVGRLDKDTEGFLILTDDGKFCFHINEPKEHTEKTYFFYAKGELTDEKIKALEKGVSIYVEEDRLTAPAKAEKLHTKTMREIAHLMEESERPRLKNTRKGDVPVTAGKITITEGKKHQVKRMVKAVGMHVVYLERIAIGSVKLDESLRRGEYRPLTDEELRTLYAENKGEGD